MSSFNLGQVKRVLHVISKLTEWSDLVIDYHGANESVRCVAEGLQRTRVSRTSVRFNATPESDPLPTGFLRIASGDVRLFIGVEPWAYADAINPDAIFLKSHEEIVAGGIPTFLLTPLLERIGVFFPVKIEPWPLTFVATCRDKVVGWDADGKPVFAQPEQSVETPLVW